MRPFISLLLIFIVWTALVAASEIDTCKQQVAGTHRAPSARTLVRSHAPILPEFSASVSSFVFTPSFVARAIDEPNEASKELTRAAGDVPARAPPYCS